MEIEIDYTPHPRQKEVHSDPHRFRVLVCGRKFGKTTLSVIECIYTALGMDDAVVWYMAPCYDDKTEILTDQGWKGFQDLDKTEKVATLERGRNKFRLKFEHPLEYHEFDYDGELVGFKNPFVDMLVTPNHRCFVQYRNARDWGKRNWMIKKAEEIEESDNFRFKKTARWSGEYSGNKDWFEFLGFWFADGYARREEVTLTQKKRADYVKDLLLRNSFDYSFDGSRHYTIYKKSLAQKLVKYGNAHTKKVPKFVKNADSDLIGAFLYGYWMGDGSFVEEGATSKRAFTASKDLADDLQELIIKVGGSANINSAGNGYTVTWLNEKYNEPVLGKGGWYRKNYKGKVRCVEVDSGLVMVRRNGKHYWCGNTYKQAKMIAWRMFIQYLPPELIRRKNEVELTFQLKRRMGKDSSPRHDSYISLKGTDDEDSLRGIPNIHLAVLDEYAFMKPHVWPMIIEPALRITEGRALFTGTPAGFNHFHNAYLLGQPGPKRDPDWKSWKLPTWENPYFPREEMKRIKKFYKDEEGGFSDIYYQEYEADFRRFSGLIYKEFAPEDHIVQPFEIPDHWMRMRAFDFGYIDPFVCLWAAIDPSDQTVYIYKEYYRARQRLVEHIQKVKIGSGKEEIASGPADPSRPDTINELNNAGIPCFGGDNNVEMGINRVAQYLKQGRLKFFADCEKVIWEIQRYEWKQPRGGMPGIDLQEVPVDKDNHAMDALRYLMMEQPDLLGAPDPDDPSLLISQYERKHSNLIMDAGGSGRWDPMFGDLDVY